MTVSSQLTVDSSQIVLNLCHCERKAKPACRQAGNHKIEYRLKIAALFSLLVMTTVSALALELPEEVRGYYKDKVSSAPGVSDGVAPTVEKAKAVEGVDIGRREGTEYDFSDESVLALAVKGWEALNKKDEQALLAYTSRCIELYQEEARNQQAQLSDFATPELRGSYEALNNVAACYFMLGEFYKQQKDWDKARENYKEVVDKFFFSQYWDPRGWWWQPGKISESEIEKIDTGYYEKD
jgi:tetratricopeptide (TPR) repeat protein